jgi:SAM-dependent methyltransferase
MKYCLLCQTSFVGGEWQCPECGWKPVIIDGFTAFSSESAWQNEGFEPAFFEKLAELEDRSFWFRNRNKLLQSSLQKYAPLCGSMLELGCGTGYVLAGIKSKMPSLHLVGADIYISGLKLAKRRLPDVEFLQLDARSLPFTDEFDVIGAFDVLEHIEDDDSVFSCIYKATKGGGSMIVTVPQHPRLWSHIDDIACHRRRYSRTHLRDKVEASGFRVVRMTSFLSLLLPFLVAARVGSFVATGNNEKDIALKPLALPLLLDAFFEKICDLERAILRLGVSLPFGGSLLCVAVKE